MVTDIKFSDEGAGQLDVLGGGHLLLEGGVVEVKGRLRLSVVENAEGAGPPANGRIGDIVIQLRSVETLVGRITESTIWVCLPPDTPSVAGPAYWRQVQLGPSVGGG